MVDLPSGTVSLVFSDIEGSTLLLSRLGPAYAEALDGQRQVLREAWTSHGGVELGTEGDSFFVAFETASDAVAATVQAQRHLERYQWPAGERVRVRMGVHTGSPTIHDGGYVGMDVHRAARVAAAANGGQVVVSQATAHLAESGLPVGVSLRDLGSHRLKDIAQAERLFQLAIDGLPNDFPPLKTLGSASSLPRPVTPLVGRDGEHAELTALVRSPGVRLVTLTGPGGSGKTRLAIGVAHGLVETFPDGVYFVPLAAVTAVEVMWTTIAEVLDAPPEGRMPPGFLEHIRHRRSLLVLDNLEQLPGADGVVAELLEAAPQVMVVATSRRPLNVGGEHQHAVPPLELPADSSFEEAQRSGAVQMFVHHARAVKASFVLTADNAADVAAICRGLDGLPLAIELAAARTKLLSPKALLARLDTALDLAAAGTQRPDRQKTLRDTIDWSYRLLTDRQQGFFRRLGVFNGGADLEAIEAVTASILDGEDALDVVADLVDASLATVTETPGGEPRVELLETIRWYAHDQLAAVGELHQTVDAHLRHYVSRAEVADPLLDSDQHVATLSWFRANHDNLREALGWAVGVPGRPDSYPEDVPLGVRLCAAVGWFWYYERYLREGETWLQHTISRAGGVDTTELAQCLTVSSAFLALMGDLDVARDQSSRSVEMCRRLGNYSCLRWALNGWASVELSLGNNRLARRLLQEAIPLARQADDKRRLHRGLSLLALVESFEGNYQPSLDLETEALAITRQIGNPAEILATQHNLACTLRMMGRVDEAERQLRAVVQQRLAKGDPELTYIAEDYAAVLAELGDHPQAVRLLGAANAERQRRGNPRGPVQEAEIAAPIALTRTALPAFEWQKTYDAGQTVSLEDVLTEACSSRSE